MANSQLPIPNAQRMVRRRFMRLWELGVGYWELTPPVNVLSAANRVLAALSSAVAVVAVVALSAASPVEAQQRKRPPARTTRAKPKPVPPKVEAAKMTCPESLGIGAKSGANYCFVLAGRDPLQGVAIAIPPHVGETTLTFDLHNRHTYSEEQMKAGRGFARYVAVIGVLTMKGELIERAAVQTEFRTAADLHERITGGAGPGGVKAVAPVGAERVSIPLPAEVAQVSLLGEVLEATTAAGRETASPGRPVAIVSNVMIEYRPRR
jgi:hypothetical protein